jgi:hypothetical protein
VRARQHSTAQAFLVKELGKVGRSGGFSGGPNCSLHWREDSSDELPRHGASTDCLPSSSGVTRKGKEIWADLE